MACIYLLNSCGGTQSFDFDITYFYPIIVTPYRVQDICQINISGDFLQNLCVTIYLRLGIIIIFFFFFMSVSWIMYILAKVSNGQFKHNILGTMIVIGNNQPLPKKVYPQPNTNILLGNVL